MPSNNKQTIEEAWKKWTEGIPPDEIERGDNFIDFEAGWEARDYTFDYLIGVLEDITTADLNDEIVPIVALAKHALEKMDG